MFGSEYSMYPEILFDSFEKMKDDYKKKNHPATENIILEFLIGQYIRIFGIPEIGIQIRYMHFKKAMKKYFPKRPKEILDAGSGIGSYVLEMNKKFPRAFITGGEIDKKKIYLSKILCDKFHMHNVSFQKMDISTKMTKNKYNIIVSIDVLEHIRKYKRVLRNFSDSLKSGGYLYIHTPHRNQKRIFPFTEGWYHSDHVREGFSMNALSREVEKSGLQIVRTYKTFGPFGRLSWELNHFFLKKNFILTGITFPFLYLISLFDMYFTDSNGWGIVVIARKPKYEKK
ncbi:MAG: class I SAM-dependent methyltransferase [Candidatus Levyibacteriota bacterium]